MKRAISSVRKSKSDQQTRWCASGANLIAYMNVISREIKRVGSVCVCTYTGMYVYSISRESGTNLKPGHSDES